MRGDGTIVSYEQVRELLDYDDVSGNLFWVSDKRSRVKGRVAGGVDRDGYRYLVVNQRKYKSHRIIWLWYHGYYPENDIDHIDGDKTNNRIGNLRETVDFCNCRNRGLRKDNKTGVPGIHWNARLGKWAARITNLGERHHLGYFSTIREAVVQRHAAEIEHDWPNCQTTSPAFLFLQKQSNEEETCV